MFQKYSHDYDIVYFYSQKPPRKSELVIVKENMNGTFTSYNDYYYEYYYYLQPC